ncbi:hypothetical protein Bca52824_093060 [Brassica carinata]|uniref:RING-type E3 ubiquitin transferase n=1 Tax=Brassica carinata TaxID=52824 RepID=A0A8X7TM22_BRACI|nr:hypothetical protein Bca52824_093060 [Brassica carinata]
MSTSKPQRSPAEIEDIILRKILYVTLTESTADPRVVYLEMTAAEILSEGKELLLSRDLMERVLIDRLSGDFSAAAAEPPFPYLVGCYRRAYDESKKIQSMKDKSLRSEMENVTREAKKLAVSYCRIHLANPDMFGNKPSGGGGVGMRKKNVSPLLPVIFSEVGSGSLDMFGGGGSSSGVQSPPGFWMSFSKTRTLMITWTYGVDQHSRSFFHISALPDNTVFKSQPDVGQQCFSGASERRPADLLSSFSTIKNFMNILYSGLHDVLMILLKSTDTRECVLHFLAEVINANASRGHIQVDPVSCASSGMFCNLSAVMLRLCEPFLDPHLTKRNKIDPKYVFYGHRLKLSDLTALHASSEEVSEWIDKDNTAKANDTGNVNESRLLQSKEATSSSGNASGQNAKSTTKYNFICECFFMTARVLNLGLLKALSDFKHLSQCTLMRDPVILPSSKTTVDRAIIQRHLLSDNHDPFNRAHLTSDMLIPDVELKARIDEFVRSHQSKKRASGEDGSSNKERIQTRSSDMLID